jgi:signal transduction histidine kinase/ActR/RegA family two-component response regulator
MADFGATSDIAVVQAEQRSRRGTWSLVAVGFSVLLLLMMTASVGLQAFAVSRGFRSAEATDALSQDVIRVQRAEILLGKMAALAASDPAPQAELHRLSLQLGTMASVGSLSDDMKPALAHLAMSDDVQSTRLDIARVQEMLGRHLQSLEAQAPEAGDQWSHWRKRALRLVFLTNNLAMLLLITGGGLLLLYAGWHLDSRQKLLEARRAVLKAERDRASFVAAAGHDLRQPLQAMSLFITTLSHGSADPVVKALTDKIAASAASMRRMINGLLDVAKLDAGLVSADVVDQALDDLLTGLREEFERRAEAKQISLVIEQTGAVVHTDPLLLESILRNLLANAITYTAEGEVRVSVRSSGRMTTVTVRDTGPGIAAEQIALIFKDFYRIGGSAGGGLGLGLGIVQRLARLIHARVTVESTPGVGTSFTVEVASGSQEGAKPALISLVPAAELAGEGFAAAVRVLLVDDNDVLRKAMVEQLAGLGADVTQVCSATEALEAMRHATAPIDVVLADYDLGGGMTGLDLLLALNDRIDEEQPGLIITGSDDPAVVRALDESDFEWLQKPIDIAVLWGAIAQARASAVPVLGEPISVRSGLQP